MRKLLFIMLLAAFITAFISVCGFFPKDGDQKINMDNQTYYVKKVGAWKQDSFAYQLYNHNGKLIGTTFRLYAGEQTNPNSTSTLITFYPPGAIYPEKELFYFRPATNELLSANRDCKNTPKDIAYTEYIDDEMKFKISHPTGLKVQKESGEPGMPYPFVTFSGTFQWCTPLIVQGALKIQKSDGFNHAEFGRVTTEQDLEKFLTKYSHVVEKIPLTNGNHLFIVKASTPIIGRAVTKKGEHYWIYLYTSYEHRWEIFKPMLTTFDIID